MWRLGVAAVRGNPVRFASTVLAIVVATGFLASAVLLRDALGSALRTSTARELAAVDAVVLPDDRVDIPDGLGAGSTGGVPAAVLPAVEATSGVAAAGVLEGPVGILEVDGRPEDRSATGTLTIDVAALDPLEVVEGRRPLAAGEVTLDGETAGALDVTVGSRLVLGTTAGARPATVVGITRAAGAAEGSQPARVAEAGDGDGDVGISAADAFAWLASGAARYDAIHVAADDVPSGDGGSDAGTEEASLVAALERAVADEPGVIVQGGEAYRQDRAGAAAGIADAIGVGLQVFAYVALFVGGFIIYNTFAIVVTQRVHEFALLRAIGASTRQVSRSVRVEAVVVALAASVAGYLAAVALLLVVLRLPPVRELAGAATVPIRVHLGGFGQVVVSGVVITVASAMVPARRASRIPPVAAMREVAVDRSGSSGVRAAVGVTLLALGAASLTLGAIVGPAALLLPGPPLLFLGTVVAGPLLVDRAGALAGHLTRSRGQPTRLAAGNARRSPARTATTVNALVIGVFLVVFTTAAGGALRDYGVRVASGLAGADLSVVADEGTAVPVELIATLGEQPGVRATLPIYGAVGTTAGGDPLAAVDPGLAASVLGLDVRDGAPLEALAGNEVALVGLSTGTTAAAVGDTITATWSDGTAVTLTVATVTDLSFDAPALLVADGTARAAGATLTADRIAVQAADGMRTEAEDAVREALRPYPNLQVLPGGFLAIAIRTVFDALIASVNVLLAGAVVIAVFGIVNTLVLSLTERTRELGLLRAVGMSRRQLRTMVRVESVLVALLGVVVGSVMGLFVAFMVTRPLLDGEGGGFPWPLGPLAVIAAGGLVVGVLASLVPARRAARLDPLAAIRTE